MFVDIRGFTALSERLSADDLVERLDRFYDLAAGIVFGLDGTLDKMVGDQVMAFFGAPFRKEDHPQRAVQAANDIVDGVAAVAEDEDSLRVGAGVGTGEAFMGNVGREDIRDFTVIGDLVNTVARIQGAAGPGEVLVTEETFRAVAADYPQARQRTLELKGKTDPVPVRVVRSGS
jgi:adenylate cyclase